MRVPVFSLRIRQPLLRELVREVAARDNISQNELLEQAAEHEVIARGALIAGDLAVAAAHLAALTEAAHADLMTASIDSFAEGELHTDLLRPRQIQHGDEQGGASEPVAMSAFQIAH